MLPAFAVIGVVLSITGCTPPPAGVFAHRVYFNGTVVTMNSTDETAQAVAVRGDEIIAVGSDDEIQALAGPNTTVHRPQGENDGAGILRGA